MYVFALPLLLLVLACADAAETLPIADMHQPDAASGDDAGHVAAADAGFAQQDDAAVPDVAAPDAAAPAEPTLPCNGHAALCERRYDEVVFPATHNAHSAQEYGYSALNANQGSGFQKQLDDGIRTFLMDVYEDQGEHVFCHGLCAFGKTSHLEGLRILADFLAAHPREVFTIIYEDHLAVDAIVEDFVATGLDALTYTHPGGAWPTLGAMIAANTRLVVTLERGAPPPAWAQNVWTLAWDTPYSFSSQAAFSCALNRGARENALFLLNHWLTAGFTPSEDGAKTVNTFAVLYGRAKGCWDETGDVPNFVAVDFYEHGDLFRVVDALNGFAED